MKLKGIWHGAKFSIWALDLSDDPDASSCPAWGFFESLPERSKKSFAARFGRHADLGPITDETKSRHLEDGIYEYKVNHGPGYRIFYFNGPEAKVILTHGCPKPKKPQLKQEIERAKTLRAQWEESQR